MIPQKKPVGVAVALSIKSFTKPAPAAALEGALCLACGWFCPSNGAERLARPVLFVERGISDGLRFAAGAPWRKQDDPCCHLGCPFVGCPVSEVFSDAKIGERRLQMTRFW